MKRYIMVKIRHFKTNIVFEKFSSEINNIFNY